MAINYNLFFSFWDHIAKIFSQLYLVRSRCTVG